MDVVNKELLNLCYKYFNRFITSKELIEQLASLNENSNKEITKIINDLKKIENNTSNEVDEYVAKKKESLKNIIDILDKVPDTLENEFINKRVDNLKKEYDKEMDSHERWYKISNYLNNNDYFNKCFDNLSDYELLEFISQYIQAPFPPQIVQEKFNKLVKVGIDNNEKEWLWRLAFNYEHSDLNFDSIVDYFIQEKDGCYLTELISAVPNKINIDILIDKINDKELVEDLINNKDVLSSHISEEQYNRLINKRG